MRNKLIRLGKALRYESVKRLPWVIVLLVLISGWAAWQSYSKTAEGVNIAKANTTDIKNILESQTELLNAIRQVTLDNNLTATQQTDIIICMLQVRQSERTTDTKENCRKKVTVTVTSTVDSPATGGANQIKSSGSSSPNNAPNEENVQPDNSQTPTPEPEPQSSIPFVGDPLIGCSEILVKLCI